MNIMINHRNCAKLVILVYHALYSEPSTLGSSHSQAELWIRVSEQSGNGSAMLHQG